MTHTPVDLTDEQRANLAKLAAYLRTLPADYPDFEMNDFVTVKSGDPDPTKVRYAHVACGTAACAVGHGPKAGIDPLPGETWRTYSLRTLVPVGSGPTYSRDEEAWEWCFSGAWSNSDNTVHGAAARIEWMLSKGVPENLYEQMRGREPLCYTPEYQSALAALNDETNEMVALSNGRLG